MEKFIPCSKCKDGFIFYRNDTVKKCSCLKAYQQKQKINLSLEKANVVNFNLDFTDYKGKDEQGNISKIKAFCENKQFETNSHLYLYGPNGTQKTTISKIILKKFIEKGLTGFFISMGNLVDYISDAYSDETKKSTIDKYLSCDVLVIDDAFDKKKVTIFKSQYQLAYIDRFIRTRIETLQKNTIFSSNVAISDIESNGFSYDIQNLLLRSIEFKKASLYFKDVYITNEQDVDVKSLWD
jgi:DNA replication protein DnaC